jgi:hypothetical protein
MSIHFFSLSTVYKKLYMFVLVNNFVHFFILKNGENMFECFNTYVAERESCGGTEGEDEARGSR